MFTHKALLDERIHYALCEDGAVGEIDIVEHILGINYEVVKDTLETCQHIVKQHGCIWEYDTLGC